VLSSPNPSKLRGSSRMDRGAFVGYSLLGLGVALAIFFPLKAKRRARIPLVAWWLCLIVGAVACVYGLSHSTAPSFASRITATGRIYEIAERRRGRDTYFAFRFAPDSGKLLTIETTIIIPGWGDTAIFDDRIFRLVYLQDNNRALKNEAIEIEILSGAHASFRDSLDARPLGKWLAVPLGAAFFGFGYFGLRYRKADAVPAVSEDDAFMSLPKS
jgi:hypothetical protein